MNHYWLWKALPCEILRENITTSVQLCTTIIDMHALDTYIQTNTFYVFPMSRSDNEYLQLIPVPQHQ